MVRGFSSYDYYGVISGKVKTKPELNPEKSISGSLSGFQDDIGDKRAVPVDGCVNPALLR